MDKTKRLPIVSKELLEDLEKRFPDRMPDPNLTYEQILFQSGQVSVVRFLRSAFEAQTKNVLENR
jgi:hypothetical protein